MEKVVGLSARMSLLPNSNWILVVVSLVRLSTAMGWNYEEQFPNALFNNKFNCLTDNQAMANVYGGGPANAVPVSHSKSEPNNLGSSASVDNRKKTAKNEVPHSGDHILKTGKSETDLILTSKTRIKSCSRSHNKVQRRQSNYNRPRTRSINVGKNKPNKIKMPTSIDSTSEATTDEACNPEQTVPSTDTEWRSKGGIPPKLETKNHNETPKPRTARELGYINKKKGHKWLEFWKHDKVAKKKLNGVVIETKHQPQHDKLHRVGRRLNRKCQCDKCRRKRSETRQESNSFPSSRSVFDIRKRNRKTDCPGRLSRSIGESTSVESIPSLSPALVEDDLKDLKHNLLSAKKVSSKEEEKALKDLRLHIKVYVENDQNGE